MCSFTGNYRNMFGVHGTTYPSILNYFYFKLQRKPQQLGQYSKWTTSWVTTNSGNDSRQR